MPKRNITAMVFVILHTHKIDSVSLKLLIYCLTALIVAKTANPEATIAKFNF